MSFEILFPFVRCMFERVHPRVQHHVLIIYHVVIMAILIMCMVNVVIYVKEVKMQIIMLWDNK